jgi:hypothetical protein
MQDERGVLDKLGRVEKLLEDSLILSAVQAGANKRALAPAMSIQNSRVSRIAKLFPRGNGTRVRAGD